MIQATEKLERRPTHHPHIEASYVGKKLFLRMVKLHFVAYTAAGNNIGFNVAYAAINSVNAGVLHAGQPFCIRPRKIRRWSSTIKTILRDYFGHILKRKVKFSTMFSGAKAILTMNPTRPSVRRTRTRKADGPSKPTIFPDSASFSLSQIGGRKSFFTPTRAAHQPKALWNNATLTSFSHPRSSIRDNCKVARFRTCDVNRESHKQCLNSLP